MVYRFRFLFRCRADAMDDDDFSQDFSDIEHPGYDFEANAPTTESLNAMFEREYVEKHANADGRFKGEDPIHIALELGYTEAAPVIFAQLTKSDKWKVHPKFGTPFTHAFQKRRHTLAMNFWDLGEGTAADVNGTNMHGHAPIHFVAHRNEVYLAEVLIGFGADVNLQDNRGRTPLIYATRALNRVKSSMITLLIEKGANANITDNTGMGPIHVATSSYLTSAIERSDPWVLNRLTSISNITVEAIDTPVNFDAVNAFVAFDFFPDDRSEVTVKVFDAIENIDAVEAVVEAVDDDEAVEAVDDAEAAEAAEAAVGTVGTVGTITAVQYMVLQEPLEFETVGAAVNMMKRGADSGVRDKNGWTLLHRVVGENKISFAMDLAELTNVNLQDRFGVTPIIRLFLDKPITENFLLVADKLIESGANLDIPSIDGSFILNWAIDNNYKDKAILLIEYGADVNIGVDGICPLRRALINYNVDIAEKLLDHGANINAVDLLGNTLLHRSLINNEPRQVTWLIDHDVNLFFAEPGEDTPLHVLAKYASRVERWEEISNRANRESVNRAGSDGNTFFHLLAMHESDVEIWKLFLDKIDIAVQNNKLQTPLHLAIRKNNMKVMDFLLSRGFKVNTVDSSGRTPVHYVAAILGVMALKLLLGFDAKFNLNLQDNQGQTLLMIALSRKASGELLVENLIERGVDLNVTDINNRTALRRLIEIFPSNPTTSYFVAKLLNAGADFRLGFPKGEEPVLHWLVAMKRPEEVILLLNNEADPNALDTNGQSLLYSAIAKNLDGLVVELLNRGVDLNVTDTSNRTALRRLIETFPRTQITSDFVAKLLNAGADFRLGFPKGEEPVLHWLVAMKRPEEVLLLLNNEADPNALNTIGHSLVYSAIARNLDGLVVELLNRGVDILNGIPDGDSLLHYAVRQSLSLSVIEALIERGADVQALDPTWSLIHWAVWRRRHDLVNLFLVNGVSVNHGANKPKSVLRLAVDAVIDTTGNILTVEALLDAGADPDDIDEPDNTGVPENQHVVAEYVLNVAVRNQRLDLVQLLLDRGASQINLDQALLKPETPAMVSIRKEFDAWGKVSSLKNTALRALRRSGEFYKLRAGLRLSSFGPTQKRLEEERKKRERRITSMSVPPQTTTSSSSDQAAPSSSSSRATTSSSSSQPTTSSSSSQPTTSSSSSRATTSSSSSRATTSSSSSQPAPSSFSTLNAPGPPSDRQTQQRRRAKTTTSSSSSQTTPSSLSTLNAPGSPPSQTTTSKKRRPSRSESEKESEQKRQKAQIQMQIKAAFRACRSGNVALVSSLLRKEPILINAKLRDGTTLHDYFLRHNKTPLRLELSKV